MHRFNMPANGRTVLCRLIRRSSVHEKKNHKETQLRTKEKKYITTPYTISIHYTLILYLYFQYPTLKFKNNTLKISQTPNKTFMQSVIRQIVNM